MFRRFLRRIPSALVLIAAVATAILFGLWWLWTLGALIILLEWLAIWNGALTIRNPRLLNWTILTVSILGIVIVSVPSLAWETRLASIALVAGGLAVLSVTRGRPGIDCTWLVVGFGYIASGLLAVLWLDSHPEQGMELLLYSMGTVVATDSGAFVVGRTLKGARLIPLISPRKTWAGLVGGLIAGTATGGLIAFLVGQSEQLWLAIAVAFGVATVSQLGDLLESAFKRWYGVKDSGQLIPGHGGLLDRADSIAAGALSLVLCYQLIGSPLS